MRICTALALIAFGISGRAYGWGGEGHQIVALIAEMHLTPEAKAGIDELLGEAEISDAEVASWADEVKRERGRPSTSSWHYVNIPITAAGYDAKRDSPRTTDIIEATASQVAAMTNTALPIEERTEALKFVVHLVGDMHQPLHCADRNGDKGGNAVLCWLLEPKGKASNLHSIWDTALLKHIKAGERVLPYAEALNAKITEDELKAMQAGNLIAWANEGQKVAREVVYKGVPLPEDGKAPPVLDETYVARAKPVVEQQLKRGGVRLAAVLNKAFAVSARK